MTKIIVQAQVWNCAQFITASILPIQKYVDEIWLFDGAYKHMKKFTEVPWSTDGTEQIVRALKLKCKLVWVPCEDFFDTEIAKRTSMIKHLNEGEWLYELHDDEIASMNVEVAFQRVRNEKEALIGFIPMIEFPRAYEFYAEIPEGPIDPYETVLRRELHALKHAGGQAFLTPRFYKWQEGLHWGASLSDLFNAKGGRWEKWSRIILGEMFLWHLKWLRERNRHKMQLDYEGISLDLL